MGDFAFLSDFLFCCFWFLLFLEFFWSSAVLTPDLAEIGRFCPSTFGLRVSIKKKEKKNNFEWLSLYDGYTYGYRIVKVYCRSLFTCGIHVLIQKSRNDLDSKYDINQLYIIFFLILSKYHRHNYFCSPSNRWPQGLAPTIKYAAPLVYITYNRVIPDSGVPRFNSFFFQTKSNISLYIYYCSSITWQRIKWINTGITIQYL